MKSLKLTIIFFNSILLNSLMHAVQPVFVKQPFIISPKELLAMENEVAQVSREMSPEQLSAMDKDVNQLYKELQKMSPEELEQFMDQVLVDQKTPETIEKEACLVIPQPPVFTSKATEKKTKLSDNAKMDKDIDQLHKKLEQLNPEEPESFIDQVGSSKKSPEPIAQEIPIATPELPVK